jgi:hypothetical protein
MARIDEGLEKLAAAWAAIPDDVRGPAAEHLTAAAALLAEGVKVLGKDFPTLQGPVVALVVQAFQEIALWQRPVADVAALVEKRFPAMVAILKALAPEEPPHPTPKLHAVP